MKNIFFLFLIVFCLSSSVFAKNNKPQCVTTALKVASYVDAAGWGKVRSEPLKVTSSTRDDLSGAEEVQVKSTVSSYTYTVSLTQDKNSESCIVNQVTTK